MSWGLVFLPSLPSRMWLHTFPISCHKDNFEWSQEQNTTHLRHQQEGKQGKNTGLKVCKSWFWFSFWIKVSNSQIILGTSFTIPTKVRGNLRTSGGKKQINNSLKIFKTEWGKFGSNCLIRFPYTSTLPTLISGSPGYTSFSPVQSLKIK